MTNILDNSIRTVITNWREEIVELNGTTVKVKNIMYFITSMKNTEVYTTTDIIKIYRTPLKFFEEQEAFKHFIKINRNIIVNYDYILSINNNKLKLNNNTMLNVSRSKIDDIKVKIMQQMGVNKYGIR